MKGYRLCTSKHHKGKRWIPVVFFAPKQKTPRGIVVTTQSWCYACMRIDVRIREGLRRRGEPYNARTRMSEEERRRRKRQYYANLSPAKKKERSEKSREWHAAKRREKGIPVRDSDSPTYGAGRVGAINGGPRLDPAPLVAEINRLWTDDISILSRQSQVPYERILRLLSGKQKFVSLSVADRILTCLDLPLSFVYPDDGAQ